MGSFGKDQSLLASAATEGLGGWLHSKASAALIALFLVGFSPYPAFAQYFSARPSFNATNHLVSVSVFQWFTATGGQLSGPWRPVEGRSNWTGTTNFWQGQIKQMMAANVDMLYVHLIPSFEQQRINLFQALNQLRSQGWNVPKVAPFLDPMITWNKQSLVDVGTTAGKDTFVGQYIRFFNQYYGVNPDAFADDFLARIDGRVVLDTWHVKFNLTNLSLLTRADVEDRLKTAFASQHPAFNNGIRMVTTALNDPTLTFADEKVPQFEINTYYSPVQWEQLLSAQLKGGYWDQNIRNPGDFLPRNGGRPYTNAWRLAIHARSKLRRVYLESWNEYDEGTGVYAANVGPPYIKSGSGNTNTDVWSNSKDPYEYIKTTARGAAAFNDWPNHDSAIVWHNIPTRMQPGGTQTATVIVRNEGNAPWSEAAKFRFSQSDFDSVDFGHGRYLIDDSQDDILTFGGIFRGRAKTFQITLRAPSRAGTYLTHWGMLQENVEWFGAQIVQNIVVDGTPLLHGAPQAIDSTGILTNSIDDFSEHTYSAPAGPIGSFADCVITRTFAAPVKSVKLFIVAGTCDDIGYVGSLLVTPNSDRPPDCATLGRVTNTLDVSSQVTIDRNTAAVTLRAKENCCCWTGWGEDTDSGRANAKLHWQVELWPPAPISPALTNSATGHFYALLSPATWTWSERAAVALGGHLTAIGNLAEQNWVYNSFSSFATTNRMLWIGFDDVASEGHFVWSSGDPVTFTYWAPGEPNNYQGNEDFVTIYPPDNPNAAHWNDWGERVFSGSTPFNGVIELVPPMGPPRITDQPQSILVNPGSNVTFRVSAVGSPALKYQWYHNSAMIIGGTNPTYSVIALLSPAGVGGIYQVQVSNALGATRSSEAMLTINRPPVARCAPRTVAAGPNCMADAVVNTGSYDPDGDSIVVAQSPPGPYPLGVTPVTLTVTDPYGLSSSCTTSVTVRDTTPPVIVCPANVLQANGVNECGAIVTFSLPTATDLCSVVTNITCVPASGSFFPVGTTVVLCAATDSAGNMATCHFDVTVRDTEPPVIVCPSDIVVTNAHDAWTHTVTFSPSASDNCPGVGKPTCSPPSGTEFGIGTHAVTAWVLDAAGNSGSCTFSVTVYPGNVPPVPVIEVSPLAHFPGYTNLIIIAPDNQNANVTFDGSKSYDPDDTNFYYFWYETGVIFSTNAVAQQSLGVGSHEITLGLDDTFPLGTNSASVTVEVITPTQAIGIIIDMIDNSNFGHNLTQPLLASLRAAAASFERDNPKSGVNQLGAFLNKVRAQVAPFDPNFATHLTAAAQTIIDAVKGG